MAPVLAQRNRASVIPILGARGLSQLEDNLGALDIAFSEAACTQFEDASRIELGFPRKFLTEARRLSPGGIFDRIRNHRA